MSIRIGLQVGIGSIPIANGFDEIQRAIRIVIYHYIIIVTYAGSGFTGDTAGTTYKHK